MNPLGHAQAQLLIGRHFEGSIAPDDEHALRAHLPDCAECSARYQRSLLVSRFDPQAPSAKARLARGLGLSAREPFSLRALFKLPLLPPAFAAVALGAFLVWHGSDTTGFQPRGAALPPQASTRVYRLAEGKPPQEVTTEVGADDELAFSYENSSANRYLMIFGIDEAQRVYWYYPAWTNAAQNPSSIALPGDPGTHELPEAVHQHLLGRELTLCHLFTSAPALVREVESRVARAKGPPDLSGLLACRKLTVAATP